MNQPATLESVDAFWVEAAGESSESAPSARWKSFDPPAFAQLSQDRHPELPNAVTVDIHYSAINYKDALAANAHPGVARKLPLVPGIDAVGIVRSSEDANLPVGTEVLIADASFGTAAHGGLATQAIVPARWCVPLAERGLTLLDAVTWGTAGFTAAQSVEQILHHGVIPAAGPVSVSGATGGVGVFAVKLLAKLGFEVVAVTGKTDQTEWLKSQGASDVIGRDEVLNESDAPLLKGRWAAAVDTVGGSLLADTIRSAKPHACVTACGLAAGVDLPLTVYPFILRGVTLTGIDSAGIDDAVRCNLWKKIGGPWQLDGLDQLRQVISPAEVAAVVAEIMQGTHCGRSIVDLRASHP